MKYCHQELEKISAALLVASGLTPEAAAAAAENFVLQETRGVITHGMRRLAASLLWLERGVINPRPAIRIVRDNERGTVLIDGDRGLGLIGCHFAMDQAIERAAGFGIGLAVIRNSQHFLSAAPYCLKAAARNMIGIACSNTNRSMGYPGATGALIGNNPIGFAAPADPHPIIFDTALTVSLGKIELLHRRGEKIPAEFLALDRDGKPTRDPLAVMQGGVCMPIGSHKGAGLAVLIELLCGVLGGGAMLSEVLPPGERQGPGAEESQCCIAIDVAALMDVAEFKRRIGLLGLMFSEAGARLPGAGSWRCREASLCDGVALEPDVASQLNTWIENLIPGEPFRFEITPSEDAK